MVMVSSIICFKKQTNKKNPNQNRFLYIIGTKETTICNYFSQEAGHCGFYFSPFEGF